MFPKIYEMLIAYYEDFHNSFGTNSKIHLMERNSNVTRYCERLIRALQIDVVAVVYVMGT